VLGGLHFTGHPAGIEVIEILGLAQMLRVAKGMAHTYTETHPGVLTKPQTAMAALPADLIESMHRIVVERTGKLVAALCGVVGLLAVAFSVMYASYKDVPAPAHPANNTNVILEPY